MLIIPQVLNFLTSVFFLQKYWYSRLYSLFCVPFLHWIIQFIFAFENCIHKNFLCMWWRSAFRSSYNHINVQHISFYKLTFECKKIATIHRIVLCSIYVFIHYYQDYCPFWVMWCNYNLTPNDAYENKKVLKYNLTVWRVKTLRLFLKETFLYLHY